MGITGSLQTFWGFQSLLQNYKDNKAPRDKNSYIEMRRPTLPMPCQAVWCALYKQSGGGDGDSSAGEGGWEVLGMINNYQKDLLKERVTHTNNFHRWLVNYGSNTDTCGFMQPFLLQKHELLKAI